MHLRFTVCSVRYLVNTHTPAALQHTFQALYLLHKAIHSHHILLQQTAELYSLAE